MTSVSSITGAATDVVNPQEQNYAISTDEFLQIMIAELTNQDPFDPVKNQDLLDQMTSIQQLESSQNMTESFSQITGQFQGFIDSMNSFLGNQSFSTASKMIGELVSGMSTQGSYTTGKVVAVSVEGKDILLELDTGEQIHIDSMSRLGGTESTDIIGSLAAGKNAEGEEIVGIIQSIEIDEDVVSLILDSGEKLQLSNSMLINKDTVYYLLGQTVCGAGVEDSKVVSYRISGTEIADVTLILENGQELKLDQLTKIGGNSDS